MASSYTKNGFVTKLNDKDSRCTTSGRPRRNTGCQLVKHPHYAQNPQSETSLSNKRSHANAVRKVEFKLLQLNIGKGLPPENSGTGATPRPLFSSFTTVYAALATATNCGVRRISDRVGCARCHLCSQRVGERRARGRWVRTSRLATRNIGFPRRTSCMILRGGDRRQAS